MSVIRRKRNYMPIISSTEESSNEINFGTYDKHNSLRENSTNVNSVLQNCSSKKYMDTYRSNIKRKDDIDNKKRRIYLTSDSDLDNSDNDNRATKKKIKLTQNKKQTIIDYDSIDTSSNSSISEIQNKTTHLRTNNGNKKRCNIVEEIRFVRKENDSDRQNYYNSHLIGTNTSALQNGQEKQSVENFKPHIENVIEGLKYKFSKYKFHIRQIQSKYITGNIITLQNAEDIVFIFSSIISKLKEELAEQQKILENSYLKWAMKSNSNEQSSCSINNEDVEIENETSFNDDDMEMMEVSLQKNNEIFSENTHRKQSSDTTKKLKKNVWESNKNTKFWQNIRSNNNRDNEISLKTKDSIVETNQTLITQVDNRNSLQSKRNVLSVLSDLEDINVVKVPKTNSTVNRKNTRSISKGESLSQNVTKTLKQPVNSKQNESTKKEITDDNSDICSTCSTVALYSPQHKHILLSNVDKQTNKLININEDVNSDDSESFILEPAISNNEKSDSQEIVIIPSNENNNFNIQHIEAKSNCNSQIVSKVPVALSNNNDSVLQKQLNSVSYTNKSSNKKYQVSGIRSIYKDINSNKKLINQIGKNIVDKKLGLICQVVINKYKQ
ncbi:hypothetical protein QLX08_000581 [Tetragonisca angustula]|uniref:Uncharacterized protein n=1 Tax=Tetragonisca angustula TaxID=166442 RepID=A0AAW1ALF9_9HYME